MQEVATKVRMFLSQKGVETPQKAKPLMLSSEAKQKAVEECFKSFMEIMNLDLTDDSLSESPKRWAKMMINELLYGLDYQNFPKITAIENKMGCAEMVVVKDIDIQSLCEHHFVPIIGKATIAYIPDKKILGLSKFNRVCDFFSKRPQVQERLTQQIFYALQAILDTENIAVSINASHLCVRMRGVKDINSTTITNKLGGAFFTNPTARQEFLKYVPTN